jgi:hypothetical protein
MQKHAPYSSLLFSRGQGQECCGHKEERIHSKWFVEEARLVEEGEGRE